MVELKNIKIKEFEKMIHNLNIEICQVYRAKSKEGMGDGFLVAGMRECIFFDTKDNTITHSSISYFETNYNLIKLDCKKLTIELKCEDE